MSLPIFQQGQSSSVIFWAAAQCCIVEVITTRPEQIYLSFRLKPEHHDSTAAERECECARAWAFMALG